ncbi:MAG TPA: protein kinase, partial [Gemmatimonadaceae bacterium]|nr:protein kinase [Gemmatimonadaceae bacterium]
HGVVHRDVKPENILLTGGHAVVADFGVAKAIQVGVSPEKAEASTRLTRAGIAIGTPLYMSPEQASAEEAIDARSDQYSLGCVLYEMLAGEPPFTGSTAQAIVARTLTETPRSITLQRHTVPPNIEAAVFTALEKLPADRFATAGEFGAALEQPSFARTGVTTHAQAAVAPASAWRARGAFAAIAAGCILAGALGMRALRPAPTKLVSRYELSFQSSQAPVPDRGIAVSPDGSQLVYVGLDSGATTLMVKPRDHLRATPLTGTAGAISFVVSPDNRSIAFVQGSQLKKMALTGGAAITLADSASPSRGIAWLDNHTIAYISTSWHQLRVVPDGGGPAVELWNDPRNFAWYPAALPGSRAVVFTYCDQSSCQATIHVAAVDTRSKKLTEVEPGYIRAQYVPTGHLLLIRRDGAMLAKRFNARTGAGSGPPIPVADSVSMGLNEVPVFGVSQEGTMFVRTGPSLPAGASYELVWVDRTGRETPVDSMFTFHMTVQGGNAGWALSPDGARLAIGINTDAGDQVWVKPLPRGPAMRVTFDSVQNYRPRWLRDGKSLTYTSRRALVAELHKRSADGTGTDELVLKVRTGSGIYEGAWSPDGKTLVVRAGGTQNQIGGRDISVIHPGVDSVPKPLIASPQFDEEAIAISPDGRWIAYETNETGKIDVFIRPFPNVDGGKWQVSSGGGRAPLWAKSGRELFFVNTKRDMVAVSISDGPTPSPGEPRTLFHMRDELFLQDPENYTPFDISPDGQRFIMARRVRENMVALAPMTVTLNWFEELRERLAKH